MACSKLRLQEMFLFVAVRKLDPAALGGVCVMFARVVEHRAKDVFMPLLLASDASFLSQEGSLAAASSVQAVSLPLGRSQSGADCVVAFFDRSWFGRLCRCLVAAASLVRLCRCLGRSRFCAGCVVASWPQPVRGGLCRCLLAAAGLRRLCRCLLAAACLRQDCVVALIQISLFKCKDGTVSDPPNRHGAGQRGGFRKQACLSGFDNIQVLSAGNGMGDCRELYPFLVAIRRVALTRPILLKS